MPKHVILDTDVGEDPDEVFAVLLALASPEIKVDMIVTSDEHGGKRAAFAGALLKALGMPRIPLVRGRESLIKAKKIFVVDSLVDEMIGSGETAIPKEVDPIAAIRQVVAYNDEVHYVCISPFTNLAELIRREPALASKLRVLVMGGGLEGYRKKGEPEHNVAYSISDERAPDGRPLVHAAHDLFASSLNMRWVLGDTTFRDEIKVDRSHAFYEQLKVSKSRAARLLLENCEAFFTQRYPGTIMHDPLTLSYLIDPTLVTFERKPVAMDERGCMRTASRAEVGTRARMLTVSTAADYGRFMPMMCERIGTLLSRSEMASALTDSKRAGQPERLRVG